MPINIISLYNEQQQLFNNAQEDALTHHNEAVQYFKPLDKLEHIQLVSSRLTTKPTHQLAIIDKDYATLVIQPDNAPGRFRYDFIPRNTQPQDIEFINNTPRHNANNIDDMLTVAAMFCAHTLDIHELLRNNPVQRVKP